MDTDILVRNYLGRLEAASAALPPTRRTELAAEVREHVDAALAEAGRADEVTVRNILERLGSPEEIVAAETGQARAPGGAAPVLDRGMAEARSRWGAIEVSAVVLLVLAWPARYLPFGEFLWLALAAVGLVLVWVSRVWSTRRKVTSTVCVIALYLFASLLMTPASVLCTTGNPAQPCPQGGPSPTVTSS